MIGVLVFSAGKFLVGVIAGGVVGLAAIAYLGREI